MATYRDKITAYRAEYRRNQIDWGQTLLTLVFFAGEAVKYLAAGAFGLLLLSIAVMAILG